MHRLCKGLLARASASETHYRHPTSASLSIFVSAETFSRPLFVICYFRRQNNTVIVSCTRRLERHEIGRIFATFCVLLFVLCRKTGDAFSAITYKPIKYIHRVVLNGGGFARSPVSSGAEPVTGLERIAKSKYVSVSSVRTTVPWQI